MTRQPPPTRLEHQRAQQRAYMRALVLNILGLLMVTVAAAGIAVVAWSVDPRLVYAAAFAAVGVGGYLLATHEAE